MNYNTLHNVTTATSCNIRASVIAFISTSTNLVVKTFYTNAIMTFFIIIEIVFAASASSLSTEIVHTKDFRGRGSTQIKNFGFIYCP